MTRGVPGQVVGSCFALAAFAVAIIAGLAAGNDAMLILFHAAVVLVMAHPVGLAAGLMMQRIVRDHLAGVRSAEAGSAMPSAPQRSAAPAGVAAENEVATV
jgi:hypothetical protein